MQLSLYLLFAAMMIGLNYLIQFLNVHIVAPFIETRWGYITFIYNLYLSQIPINMTEFIGSIVAVGVTYLIKFFLDKFVVFRNRDKNLKATSKQFLIYMVLAIFTTVENIGIQLLLSNVFKSPLIISVIIALSTGYITKFFLDRKYVFQNGTPTDKITNSLTPKNR